VAGRAGVGGVLLLLLLLVGCTSSGSSEAAGEPGHREADYRPAFEEVTFPEDSGRVLRDAIHCGNRWYMVGALQAAAGSDPQPAAWESTDGRIWRSVRVVPLTGSFYGPRSVLSSVACANGKVAALGAQSGGAHGNPRTSAWRQLSDGALAEVAAPFELYGGDEAVDVGRIVGGPDGFLIAGNRTSGPAAWVSRDGSRFVRHEVQEKGALARDGAVFDGRYILVGAGPPGSRAGPGGVAWESTDGSTWLRANRIDAVELQRVVAFGGKLIAVGQRGATFTAWLNDRGEWSRLGDFGAATPTGARSLTVAGGQLVVSADQVWSSPDGRSWRRVVVPATPVAVAGDAASLLVVGADRAWSAGTANPPGR